jgi:oligoribonuclease NrnB/cAMP/cGMP phosphodiesterase (DHH superfamily)
MASKNGFKKISNLIYLNTSARIQEVATELTMKYRNEFYLNTMKFFQDGLTAFNKDFDCWAVSGYALQIIKKTSVFSILENQLPVTSCFNKKMPNLIQSLPQMPYVFAFHLTNLKIKNTFK